MLHAQKQEKNNAWQCKQCGSEADYIRFHVCILISLFFDHVIVIKRTFPQSSINKLKFYVTYGICFVLPKQGCSCWYGVFRVKEFGSQVWDAFTGTHFNIKGICLSFAFIIFETVPKKNLFSWDVQLFVTLMMLRLQVAKNQCFSSFDSNIYIPV